MQVPINWLRDYVEIPVGVEELARRLTMAGIAVEYIDQTIPEAPVLHLELTPNRADCLGIMHVAREVAAVTGGALHLPQPPAGEAGGEAAEYVTVEILAPELCSRYLARVFTAVNHQPAPLWMQERLQAAGVRPINAMVDITNYVMLETGQPLHAFDFNYLRGRRIEVRRARPGEKISTLDGTERCLDPETLVIADQERAVALAGIMGGANSEITDQTATVLLESAHFNGVNIRQTSRRLGLRTESSLRFEKGRDIEMVAWAADRAAQLVRELGVGTVVGGHVDCYLKPWAAKTIVVRVERVNTLLGTQIPGPEMIALLQRLGLAVEVRSAQEFTVAVPAHRLDLEREIDIVEEVARLYGYDRIPLSLPATAVIPETQKPDRQLAELCRQVMIAGGLTEVINFSFEHPAALDRIRLAPADIRRQGWQVANPLHEGQRLLRTSLLPGLLETAARNASRQQPEIAIFEIGRVYFPSPAGSESRLPDERVYLGALLTGRPERHWQVGGRPWDYYYLKGLVEELLVLTGIKGAEFAALADDPSYHPGKTALLSLAAGDPFGRLGEIHPDVTANYDFTAPVFALELELSRLLPELRLVRTSEEQVRFPSVTRDLAFLVPDQVPAAEVEKAIWRFGQPLLRRLSLFDLYQGPNLPAGTRSLAYALLYQAADRTLTDGEVNLVHQRIVNETEQTLGIKLR